MPNTQKVIGFHIDRGNGTVRAPRSSGTFPIQVGSTYKATGRLKMCDTGCHASLTLENATHYRLMKPGRTVSLVEVWGDLRKDGEKVCGRYRKVLATKRIDPYGRIPTVEKKVFTGMSEPVSVNVLDPDFLKSIESELRTSYRQNKRRIDAQETIVILPQ